MIHPLQGRPAYAQPLGKAPAASVRTKLAQRDEVRFSASPGPSSVKRGGPKWLERLKSCWPGWSAQRKPLHTDASEELKRVSDQEYQAACIAAYASAYVYAGNTQNYLISPTSAAAWANLEECIRVQNAKLSLNKILEVMRKKAGAGHELQVLDIGCGRGGFVCTINQPGRVKAYGMTAEGFSIPPSLPPEQYLYGNAQNLVETLSDKLPLKPNRKGVFDLIFSQMTFLHLPDPLAP